MASAAIASGSESSGRFKKHRLEASIDAASYLALHPEHEKRARISGLIADEPSTGCGSCYERGRLQLRETLDDHDSSVTAHILSAVVMIFICSSTICVVLETVHDVAEAHRKTFELLEKVFTAAFSLEILLRLWTAEGCRVYFCNPSNLVDILATSPWYVEQGLHLLSAGHPSGGGMTEFASAFKTLRMIRLLRVLRMAKAARHSEAISTVLEALSESLQGLFVLVAFMVMGAVMSGTLVYTVESEVEGTSFVSVPAAAWWAISTMTTVGYGDMVPNTPLGKVIGSCTMLLGILVVSVSVAIISTSFTESYQRRVHLHKIAKHLKRVSQLHGHSSVPIIDVIPQLLEPSQDPQHPNLARSLKSLGEETSGLLTDLETIITGLTHKANGDDSCETDMIDFLQDQCRIFFKAATAFAELMAGRVLESEDDGDPLNGTLRKG